MAGASPSDLLSAMPMPALTIGADERIARMNTGAVSLLGAGLTGRHYITALRQPGLLETIEAVGRTGIARQIDYLAHDGDRDTTWTAHVASAGPDLLVIFEDRSEAEAADQMRRDFVANVSHELRTPLTAVIGYIETLQGPARDDAAARARFLATMAGEAQRMNRLVADLLSLSRVEAAFRLRPTDEVDLTDLIPQVITLLGPIARAADVRIMQDLPLEAVMVAGDNDQLRQVFVNLLENAVKYGSSTVSLNVQTEPEMRVFRGPGVRIDVVDDGPGIDPVHLPRLTQRFYRVDTHRAREVGGTGLGLAIVKHILSRHRGRLRISSEPGRGSRFSVLLPLLPSAPLQLS